MDLINTPRAFIAGVAPLDLQRAPVDFARFTTSETLTRAALGRVCLLDSAGTNTLTVAADSNDSASDFITGEGVILFNRGAGIWTIAAGNGVTIISLDSALTFIGQGGFAALVKDPAASTWLLRGDLTT